MQQYLKQLTLGQKLAIVSISIAIFGANAVIEHIRPQPMELPVHVDKK